MLCYSGSVGPRASSRSHHLLVVEDWWGVLITHRSPTCASRLQFRRPGRMRHPFAKVSTLNPRLGWGTCSPLEMEDWCRKLGRSTMSKQSKQPLTLPRATLWAAVITGVLGCVGGTIAAVVTLGQPFVQRLVEPTPVVIVVTATSLRPGATVPIPVPSTSTPEPVIVPPTSVPTQSAGPFREHQIASVGTGPFAQVTYSDGAAPFSQDELNTNHFRIQRIRLEENPDGCGISVYDTNKVWFSGSANTVFTVNGQEIGRLSVDTGRHGHVAGWPIHVGDELCAVGFAPSGFHIIIGPDMYHHYDSYCYRGHCEIENGAK